MYEQTTFSLFIVIATKKNCKARSVNKVGSWLPIREASNSYELNLNTIFSPVFNVKEWNIILDFIGK